MTSAWVVAEDDSQRSAFVRQMLAKGETLHAQSDRSVPWSIPKVLVQYWDDSEAVPKDVRKCIDTWKVLASEDFTHLLFDDVSAGAFIAQRFDPQHSQAFAQCEHPAMRADYFRLCYMVAEGGIYVDADDDYSGRDLQSLISDGCLQLNPLCYDIITDSMMDPFQVADEQDSNATKIFYANNNPIISPPSHPVIRAALNRATVSLLDLHEGNRDIQSLTGPGNLTACLVAHVIETESRRETPNVRLLKEWDSFAVSNWQLEYRMDERNWRRWMSKPGDAQ